MTLYQLAAEYRAAAEALDASESPDVDAILGPLEGGVASKADAICALVREAQAEETALKTEAARLRALADRAASRAARLKQYLRSNMEAAGLGRLRTERFRVSVVPSPASVRWVGAGLPPEAVRVTTVTYDARKVLDLAEKGSLPDGFELVRGSHLRIS